MKNNFDLKRFLIESKSILLGLIGGLMIGTLMWALFYDIVIPPVIKQRAKDLNIMHYDSKTNSFVPNDTIVMNSDEFNYLLTGEKK